MSNLSIVSRNGCLVNSIEDWFLHSPPKRGALHWKDGRSAKELAKAWFRTGRPEVPTELTRLFDSHPATKHLSVEIAMPEVKIAFDSFRGEKRNCDLVLRGRTGDAVALVGIEAKAGEEFGPLVSDYTSRTVASKSNVPNRVALLGDAILGPGPDTRQQLDRLRYQLLHGVAATLVEAAAQGASLAVFVVHEFLSSEVALEKVHNNAQDLQRFVRALPGCERARISDSKMLGPISVPGGQFVPSTIPLLIGKVTTVL